MSNILCRAGVLVVLVGLAGGAARAKDHSTEKLTLKSAYSSKVLASGARQVRLSLTLDEKGTGFGTLTLDPNIINEFGSTDIAIQEIQVRATLVSDENAAAKGRRMYELRPTGEEGLVQKGCEYWFLVRPLKTGEPSWLLFADKDGKVQDVLMVE